MSGRHSVLSPSLSLLRLKMVTLIWIPVMLFYTTDGVQIQGLSQPNPVVTAAVGENVTLHCSMLTNDQSGEVSWYQQKLGYEPRMIVYVLYTNKNYKDEFQPPKFNFRKEERSINLKIVHVEQSDEAMYYCSYGKYGTKFGNGTFLSVKGNGDLKLSVFQSSVQDSVPVGASMTLQCSVLSESRMEELRVFWLRAAPSQSDPQIIYTHHDSSRQCERVTSTHTCVYNFSKNILSLSDAGTYYCAVAACGKIVLGNGTRVQMEKPLDPVVMVLSVALGLCTVVLFVHVISSKRRKCEYCGLKYQDSAMNKTTNQSRDGVEVNFAALDVNKTKRKRDGASDNVYTDVFYSSVS